MSPIKERNRRLVKLIPVRVRPEIARLLWTEAAQSRKSLYRVVVELLEAGGHLARDGEQRGAQARGLPLQQLLAVKVRPEAAARLRAEAAENGKSLYRWVVEILETDEGRRRWKARLPKR